MKFKKGLLQQLAFDDVEESDGVTKIKDEICGTRRWSVDHTMIFECAGKFYESAYSVGATEQQDETPYEYEEDEIECVEVVEKEITITQWVAK